MGKEEELGTLGEDGFSWIMLGVISDLRAVKNVGKYYIYMVHDRYMDRPRRGRLIRGEGIGRSGGLLLPYCLLQEVEVLRLLLDVT